MRVFSSWAMKRGASPDRRFAGMDCRMSFSRLWKRPSVVTKVSMLRLLLSSQTQRQKLNTAPLVLPVNSAIDYGHSRFSRCRFSSNSSTASSPLPSNKSKINFCQLCGGQTKFVIPDGDEKKRPVCTVCGKVYYENPKMVVGCLVEHDNKVLLCKRKIPPSYGLWTLPAGYLELGESAAAGAARETLEEACADVEIISPFAQLDIPRIGQYRAILSFEHSSRSLRFLRDLSL